MFNRSIWLIASLFIVAIICLANSEFISDYYYSRSHNPLERALLHQERGVLSEIRFNNSSNRILDQQILTAIENHSSYGDEEFKSRKALGAVLITPLGKEYDCTISFSRENERLVKIFVYSVDSNDSWRSYIIKPDDANEPWWREFWKILQQEISSKSE